ncbi:hypothetical protein YASMINEVIRUS_1435 [Yasminevirus sp. GU-2018]|uniref:Uncharacterized protein n=1 Tax=Yasminevirus sp. GU-2018 TaxID=2420051 RepID=A0A5K0UBD4_9VIRU|nr:hypothetical protein YASMINEVIRUS_1435 [Yasminevirus sp. GU-2018]
MSNTHRLTLTKSSSRNKLGMIGVSDSQISPIAEALSREGDLNGSCVVSDTSDANDTSNAGNVSSEDTENIQNFTERGDLPPFNDETTQCIEYILTLFKKAVVDAKSDDKEPPFCVYKFEHSAVPLTVEIKLCYNALAETIRVESVEYFSEPADFVQKVSKDTSSQTGSEVDVEELKSFASQCGISFDTSSGEIVFSRENLVCVPSLEMYNSRSFGDSKRRKVLRRLYNVICQAGSPSKNDENNQVFHTIERMQHGEGDKKEPVKYYYHFKVSGTSIKESVRNSPDTLIRAVYLSTVASMWTTSCCLYMN